MNYRGWWKPDTLFLCTIDFGSTSNGGPLNYIMKYKSECIPINSVIGYTHPSNFPNLMFQKENNLYKSFKEIKDKFFSISLMFNEECLFAHEANFKDFLEILRVVHHQEEK